MVQALHPHQHDLWASKGNSQRCLVHLRWSCIHYRSLVRIHYYCCLLLVHCLGAIGASEHLVGLLRLHDWVPTENHSGNQACKLHSLRAWEEFSTKESEKELWSNDIAWSTKLKARDQSYKFSSWLQIVIEASLLSEILSNWAWNSFLWRNASIAKVFDFKEPILVNYSFQG